MPTAASVCTSRVLSPASFLEVDRDFNRLAEEREAVLAEISARNATGVQAGQLRELHAKAESLARAMVAVEMRRERVRLELSTDVLANDAAWHKTGAEAKTRRAAAAEAWRQALMQCFLAEFGLSPADRSRVTQSDAQASLPGKSRPLMAAGQTSKGVS